jgi:DNA-binding GntR family transcriptional regulator
MTPFEPARNRLQPVERKRLVDLAHDAIRESIVGGRFSMGERLVETQLAHDLGMSRAPIREALRRLAQEGLVEDQPHRGALVARMSASNISDLYNVRLGVETIGLRLFIKREAPTKPLWRAIADMEKAAERNHMAGVVTGEFEFHHSIAVAAENHLLMSIFGDLEGQLMMALALDDATFEQLGEVPAEHVPIVEAIDAGDELRAVVAFEEHLVSSVGALLERLGGSHSDLLLPLASATTPPAETHAE